MMAAFVTKACVNAQAQLELVDPLTLPTDSWVDVTIEYQTAAERAAEDEKWDAAFARSKDQLRQMGRNAIAQHRAGETVELDMDELERDDP
jgi:hypothetical protein